MGVPTILAAASLVLPALQAGAAGAQEGPVATPAGDPVVSWAAPSVFVAGLPFYASVEVTTVGSPHVLPRWSFSAAAFEVDGRPLAPEGEGPDLELQADSSWRVRFDLAPYLPERPQLLLGCRLGGAEPAAVVGLRPAPPGTDFLSMPVDELREWSALLVTNRGTMLFDLWPDVAPEHVRNLLDLCQTGFYDGVLFHRVIPGFMIQGGDPYTKRADRDMSSWGQGSGPRILDAEFSDRHHVRGVLSMARGGDPHSASCQFFVCQDTATHLDGQYTAFGMLRLGFETLDRIALAPTMQRTTTPIEPQRIERAIAVRPLQPGKDREG